jgi:hypothetical protein
MIDHVSIGIRDIENVRKFYDAALKPLGYTCLSSSDAMLGLRQGCGRFLAPG